MLSGNSAEEIVGLLNNDRETTLKEMLFALDFYNISYKRERKEAFKREDLPPVCILSLETPRCWHWSLYYRGIFYDPEHGISEDFPKAKRKYYWEILF